MSFGNSTNTSIHTEDLLCTRHVTASDRNQDDRHKEDSPGRFWTCGDGKAMTGGWGWGVSSEPCRRGKKPEAARSSSQVTGPLQIMRTEAVQVLEAGSQTYSGGRAN